MESPHTPDAFPKRRDARVFSVGKKQKLCGGFHKWGIPKMDGLPVVPHKAVAEVSKIGNL